MWDVPQDTYAESRVFRDLLHINLELSAQNGESFAFHRASGHVLLRSFFHVQAVTPQQPGQWNPQLRGAGARRPG
jgi:hypothetical protein